MKQNNENQSTTKEKKHRSKISRIGFKNLVSLICFAILLVITLSLSIAYFNFKKQLQSYYNYAQHSSEYFAKEIDSEKIIEYYKTKEADEYYNEISKELKEVAQNLNQVAYYSIIVPEENEYTYLWTAGLGSEILGVSSPYDSEKLKQYILSNVFTKDPNIKLQFYTGGQWGYMCSLFYPIYDEAGTPIAVIETDMPGDEIVSNTISFSLFTSLLVLIIMTIGIIFYYLFIRRNVILPVNILNNAVLDAVNSISEDKTIHIDLHTNDELENLARNFEQMTKELKDYINTSTALEAEKQAISSELDMAAKIQQSMLPELAAPYSDNPHYELFASMKPAKEVGGDFYDFFMIDENRLCMVVADVSGKGVPAALFGAISKSILKSSVLSGLSPAQAFYTTNNQLCEHNSEDYFVSVWMGYYDFNTGKMLCANAGHEYPIIKKSDGKFKTFKDKHDLVLGMMEEIDYSEYELDLSKDDVFFMYSDGIPEAHNEKDELLEQNNVENILNDCKYEHLSDLANHLNEGVNKFVGKAPQFDDITMVFFRRK